MRSSFRSANGNMLFITAVTIVFIILPILLVLNQFGTYRLQRQRVQDLVDAAGLIAANDISKIVVNDPKFGYVSLSNFPPTGRATCAPDGEPLPVTSINTWMGTLRLNAIVGRELQNDKIRQLVASDRASLDRTINELNSTINDSLDNYHETRSDKGAGFDMNGEVVDPMADVTKFLAANLPDNMELQSVQLSNGWLMGGGTTTIPIPQPQQQALVGEADVNAGNYKAFVDIPVDNMPFSFAGVGKGSTIVSSSEFHEADVEHICSIVRIECKVVLKSQSAMPFGIKAPTDIECIACCQPYCQPDTATNGAMTIRFTGGPVPGLLEWSDFLSTDNFHDNQVAMYDVVGGDYPVDTNAQMKQLQSAVPTSTAEQFAEHFYYWLRNGHVRPRLDAIFAMVDEPFQSGSNQVYTYEFADNGTITRRLLSGPFPTGVIADAQFSAVADTSVDGGVTPIIVFRDNVKNLGTRGGGKHCGQPLAGYPLNWTELQQCSTEQQLACRFPLRRSYCRGLALDIEIGGTRKLERSRRPMPVRNRV